MTAVSSRNGYTRVPTADPDLVEGDGATGGYGGIQHGPHRDWDSVGQALNSRSGKGKKKASLNQRPGLFHMFGDRGKYAANHVSVAIASQSESEHEAERIELTEIKPKRPKLRRGRLKSNSRSPKIAKSRQKFRFHIIEEPILPGDTVQRVALRYGCPSSEVRRVNNLYRDQDFYALTTVKIPVREHGILTDPKAREKCRRNNVEEPYHSSGGATSADDLRLGGPSAYYRSDEERSSGDADDEVGDDSDSPEVRDVSIQSALKWKHSQHDLLEKFDAELQRVRENTDQRLANLNEVALTMTTPTIQPIIAKKKETYEGNLLKMNLQVLDWRIIMIGGVVLIVTLLFGAIGWYIYDKLTDDHKP